MAPRNKKKKLKRLNIGGEKKAEKTLYSLKSELIPKYKSYESN
jgi:hypothetical protein